MNPIGTGDLGRSLLLSRSTGQLQNAVARLTKEVATGQHSDTARALRGDLLPLSDIAQGIELSQRHAISAKTIGRVLSAQSTATESIAASVSDLEGDLRTSSMAPDKLALLNASERAAAGFADAISKLNTTISGRHVFAGQASDQKPFGDPATILAEIVSDIPADTPIELMKDHIRAWFGPGGSFETRAYQGAGASQSAVSLGKGHNIEMDATAMDRGFRDSLAGLALGAVGSLRTPEMSDQDLRVLLSDSAEMLSASASPLLALQARLGTSEERVENALAEAETRLSALEITRTELLQAEPYDTAIALQAATQRLDALFLVTSRLSRLSLTEYLR